MRHGSTSPVITRLVLACIFGFETWNIRKDLALLIKWTTIRFNGVCGASRLRGLWPSAFAIIRRRGISWSHEIPNLRRSSLSCWDFVKSQCFRLCFLTDAIHVHHKLIPCFDPLGLSWRIRRWVRRVSFWVLVSRKNGRLYLGGWEIWRRLRGMFNHLQRNTLILKWASATTKTV
jgi:hypothetical protein